MRGPELSRSSRVRLYGLSVLIIVLVLIAWEGWAAQGATRARFFPPPTDWFMALQGLSSSGVLWSDLAATGRRFGLGMGAGVLGGWVLGVALGSAPRSRVVLDPIIALLHPLPKISLYPLLLLLLGFGEAPKVAVVAVSTFFPMFVNTLQGVREADPALLEVTRSFRAGRLMVLRRVVLPGSIPFVLAGLRLALNTGLTVTIAVELITTGDGLGARMWLAWQILNTADLYAVLLVIAVFGLVMNGSVERLARKLAPWRDVA
jgi:ABC-type nitrate/sulfonate/bicarbonate transport system permease component